MNCRARCAPAHWPIARYNMLMSRRPKRNLEFIAVDPDGKQYRVIEYQELSDPRSRGAIEQRSPGTKLLKTDDGATVARIDKGIYELQHAFGAVRLTSDDPNAP
jgi:hypothetical protein